jgi:hypothetical protein
MSQLPPPPPPPPPGTPPPPPPEAWGQAPTGGSFSVGNAISYGWNAYWKNVGPMVVMVLVIIAANIVIGLLGSGVSGAAGRIVLQLISFVVGVVLAMGLIRAALAVVEGRTPEVNMIFQTEGFVPYLLASIVFGIAVFAGLILLIVPGIIIAVMWHFFGYVIVEHPETGVLESLNRSAEITKGHRWQLFGLGLLLILINIVGVLACFVGLIFTYGITAVTVAYAYKTLSGQPVAQV